MAAACVAVLLAVAAPLGAKDKEKSSLPDFVWQAKSVTVEILPDSADPADDLYANQKAQENVEKALLSWGRFRVEQEESVADLVIGVRKGSGKVASPTISRGPGASRPGTGQTTDDTIRIGVHTPRNQGSSETAPGVEVGIVDDTLEVFQSGHPAPVWKYSAKDALKAPGMAAVEKLRDAVEEAEDAAKQKQSKSPAPKKTP